MSEDINGLINRVGNKHLGDKPKEKILKRISFYVGAAMWNHKIILSVSIGVIIFIIWLGLFLFDDFITKRQAYPIRNVLYQVTENVSFSGGEATRDSRWIDQDSVATILRGNIDGTKLGDLIGIVKSEMSDEVRHYHLENQHKTRLAYANEKSEKIQAGLRIGGSIDFKEQYAELIGKPGKFFTYSFIPERGERNIQLNVLVDEDNNKRLVNELVTYRSIPLGLLWGEKFRHKTELSEFPDNESNRELTRQLFETIDKYDKDTSLDKKARETLVRRMLDIEKKLRKLPVYCSREDGLIDWLPQESSTFLFGNPTAWPRIKSFFGIGNKAKTVETEAKYPDMDLLTVFLDQDINNPNNDVIRLRVENKWDLWPGNYWLLNRIHFGKSPNIVNPFQHRNNGGYIVRDGNGVVAAITIRDFVLHYGDDLVYFYYLDKDGDGKIDQKSELIGQVLYRTSWDEHVNFEKEIGAGQGKKDISKRFVYSFMAGNDWEKRFEEFYLCNTIESFIVNELSRGFGKHSDIGWINNIRSSILLRETLSIQNFGRALTPESTIVAKDDIIALLRAAGRVYINNYIAAK